MRGTDNRQDGLFSYISLEARVPNNHPLRSIRGMVDEALKAMSRDFTRIYSHAGRPSIAPERLLRALLLQVLYSIRSERLLIEELDYNLLYRWFVGLSADEPVWERSTFSKNRDRLLDGDNPDGAGRNAGRNFHGETRTNDTHASTTDPEARMYRKSFAHPATRRKGSSLPLHVMFDSDIMRHSDKRHATTPWPAR